MRRLVITLFIALFASNILSAQMITISGTIKDANDEPLVPVQIVEKGTTNGTITDSDGNFSIRIHRGGSIVVTMIGYQGQEYGPFDKDTVLNIVLNDDSEELDYSHQPLSRFFGNIFRLIFKV